ncbi:MAG: glycosyltransferase [Desulfobacterales bacterium]|nr:glycosyltransferase [Desulfobacterales bacterium]MDJ0884636.1 glycosyltransferase [Desulfobacterales bacterium]
MKVLVYCQHVLGVGHFFRTLEICRALAGHDIVLVSGGPQTPAALPRHVRRRQLPELAMDAAFQGLHSPAGACLDTVRSERRRRLHRIVAEEAPDIFLVELYPIGRRAFRFELDPLLAAIAAGDLPACKVVCSVRDILVEKKKAEAYDARAVRVLNESFDALLVHADPRLVRLEETFGPLAQVNIPVVYTGYVATRETPVADVAAWRQSRGIGPGERLVLASAGGGAVGFDLLRAVSRAMKRLQSDERVILQAFTGPFMPPDQTAALARLAGPTLRLARFSSEFGAWLQAADASVSMAGYNTCMNILATGAKALVYPFGQNREQGMRARRLAAHGTLGVLDTPDLAPDRLAGRLRAVFEWHPAPTDIDLDGAVQTAAWLENLVRQGGAA